MNAENWILVIAGLIMVATLWMSKKARSVTETEINLGRQNQGFESEGKRMILIFRTKKNLTLSQVVITYFLRLLNLDEFVRLYFLSY